MKRGFGSTQHIHSLEYAGRLDAFEQALTGAERVLHGGDCHAGVDEAIHAAELRGEAVTERRSSRMAVIHRNDPRWQALNRRYNFLRQSLKNCIG